MFNLPVQVDGVTGCLTTDVSLISGSFVIARNSAFTFKGKSVGVKQLGRELSIRRATTAAKKTREKAEQEADIGRARSKRPRQRSLHRISCDLGPHHSSDSFKNVATSAGSTVEPEAEKPAE